MYDFNDLNGSSKAHQDCMLYGEVFEISDVGPDHGHAELRIAAPQLLVITTKFFFCGTYLHCIF